MTRNNRRNHFQQLALLLVVSLFLGNCISTVNANDDVGTIDLDDAEGDEELIMEEISHDNMPDGMLLPLAKDYDACDGDNDGANGDESCGTAPPKSTVTTRKVPKEVCNADNNNNKQQQDDNQQTCRVEEVEVDEHWGSDERILNMRDKLRSDNHHSRLNKRPPIFIIPGLASTRLVAWKHKDCTSGKKKSRFVSDIKFQDYVWLNVKLIVQLGTIDSSGCWEDCMTLGWNQSDSLFDEGGCKLRADEGLDAIASLAPPGMSSDLVVGQTNTVFAWLHQWLADNLGYDVSNMIALPYDWRLTPSRMEERDGYFTQMRKRIEATVQANGGLPGIVVAHSMGNSIFRYFLLWLKVQMRKEAFDRYLRKEKKKALRKKQQQEQGGSKKTEQQPEAASWFWGFDHLYHSFFGEQQEGGGGAETADAADEKEDVSSSTKTAFAATQTNNDNNNKDGDNKDDNSKDDIDISRDKQRQLWELAQYEGDTNFLEFVQKHIWTYVGLSAPLLGAMNPLRSVISGENMGLPFTDERARKLELSFGCTNTVSPISTDSGFCDGSERLRRRKQKKQQHGNNNNSTETTSSGTGGASQSTADDKQQDAVVDDDYRVDDDSLNLFCLEDLVRDIEDASATKLDGENPWKKFPALENLLKKRVDWDTDFDTIRIVDDTDSDGEGFALNAQDVSSGKMHEAFDQTWKEKGRPMQLKLEQLQQSFWESHTKNGIPNMLERAWERPYIKHVIMAYGVDTPTEVGYEYRKPKADPKTTSSKKEGDEKYDGLPSLSKVIWETSGGLLETEHYTVVADPKKHPSQRGGIMPHRSKLIPFKNGTLSHSGDGTIPYLSMSWAHTWLLHAIRAKRFSSTEHTKDGGAAAPAKFSMDPMTNVQVSYRPQDQMEWKPGHPPRTSVRVPWSGEIKQGEEEHVLDFAAKEKLARIKHVGADTGTSHPHGTKYKPEMVKFHNIGVSRKQSNMKYSTTVIEAAGIEHKETTRNYDILAAVFGEILIHMHDDFGLV